MMRTFLIALLLALGLSAAQADIYVTILPGGCGTGSVTTVPSLTIDSTGRLCNYVAGSISATNPSVSATGSAVPSQATYFGMLVGGNLVGVPGTANGLKVDSSAVTQPVSAVSWPLPTGAATQTTLAAIQTALGSPFQAGGNIGNASFGVAAGGNTAAVKAANTGPSTTDPGLVVLESPNGPGTFNGALTNPAGSTMTLGSTTTAYTAGLLVASSSTATASASWALSAATVTVSSCPSPASAGATIYDSTAAKPVGQFASCTGTTLTLQSGALAASSGSSDALVLVNNPSFSILNSGASIQRVRVSSNDTTSTAWHGQGVQVDLWTAAPTWTNGDRGTWLPATGAGFHLGSYTCTFGATWGDGVACEAAAAAGSATFPKLASGSTIYWSLQATTGSGVTGASKVLTLVPEIVN